MDKDLVLLNQLSGNNKIKDIFIIKITYLVKKLKLGSDIINFFYLQKIFKIQIPLIFKQTKVQITQTHYINKICQKTQWVFFNFNLNINLNLLDNINQKEIQQNILSILTQIVSISSKKIILYDYHQCIIKYETNIKSQIHDVVSDLNTKLYIYCSRGLIEWDLIKNKKINEYNIDHSLFKHLGYQVQLQRNLVFFLFIKNQQYYLKGTIIFFNKEHEYYALTLNENKLNIDKFPQTQYSIFLSNGEGSMYLLFTYCKKAQNYLRVFSYQN